MDIYVKKAIIHQFSPSDTDLLLADKYLNITPKIEEYLAQGDSELLGFIRDFRRATKDAGIYCICSYRTIDRIKKLDGLFEVREILKMSLLKSLSEDDIQTIKYNLEDESRFAKAL